MSISFNSGCMCLLSAIVMLPPMSEPPAYGKLTVTESLIRQEILRLGGDWESGTKPKLIGFLGENFESEHFEMLTHLPSVEFFIVQECPVDDFAIKCLSSVAALKRLDFVRCDFDATCLSLLRSNRELRALRFEETRLCDKAMRELTRVTQIEILEFSDVDLSGVSDETFDRLARMSSLKSLTIWNCKGLTAARIERLKSAVPDDISDVR